MEDEEKGTHIDDKERAEIPTLLLVSDDELGLGVAFPGSGTCHRAPCAPCTTTKRV